MFFTVADHSESIEIITVNQITFLYITQSDVRGEWLLCGYGLFGRKTRLLI